LLDLSSLDIRLPPIDSGDHDIVNEILCNVFFLEGDEAEATRLTSVYVLQNASINYLSVLLEVMAEFFDGEFEIETADKNLAAWVFECDFSVWLISSVFGLGDHIWVRLGDARLHHGSSASETPGTTHH
jgi:hypothetical protein